MQLEAALHQARQEYNLFFEQGGRRVYPAHGIAGVSKFVVTRCGRLRFLPPTATSLPRPLPRPEHSSLRSAASIQTPPTNHDRNANHRSSSLKEKDYSISLRHNHSARALGSNPHKLSSLQHTTSIYDGYSRTNAYRPPRTPCHQLPAAGFGPPPPWDGEWLPDVSDPQTFEVCFRMIDVVRLQSDMTAERVYGPQAHADMHRLEGHVSVQLTFHSIYAPNYLPRSASHSHVPLHQQTPHLPPSLTFTTTAEAKEVGVKKKKEDQCAPR